MRRLKDIFSKKKCPPLAEAHRPLGSKYRAFKNLLAHNQTALKMLADMEQLYYSGKPFSLTEIRIRYEALFEAVMGIIYSLEALSGKSQSRLEDIAGRIDTGLFKDFNPKCSSKTADPVLSLEDVTLGMKTMTGTKAANLAVIKNDLGLNVPPGFVITAFAFEKFIDETKLLKHIKEELSHISSGDVAGFDKTSSRLRKMVLESHVPSSLQEAILKAYRNLEERTRKGVRIAMRSSAVGEDTEATFAGQYETVLNVTQQDIIEAYKRVLASKYSSRAIAYRLHYGLDDRETPMCVLGIAMIDAEASGVLYSVDPSSRKDRPVKINALWGIGEELVGGSAPADVFVVARDDRKILERQITFKKTKLATLETGGIRPEAVPEDKQSVPCLDEETVVKLAGYGLLLEEFFGGPQDIEWAVDTDKNLFILQSRPLHLPEIMKERGTVREYPENPVLFSGGVTASYGVATGRVFIAENESDLNNMPYDVILVAKTASPDLVRGIGKIKGIITDIGSTTSHMASVAREFGIPAIMNAGNASTQLPRGEVVTLLADTATVYRGVVTELAGEIRPARKLIFDSPIHRRMRDILDKISPLNLTDPASPSFAPEGCRTFHDVIRFTHEAAVREMFGITEATHKAGVAIRLSSNLPLQLYLIDLGGGLRDRLTACNTVTADQIESAPMKAIWNGFTHPGVNWAGTMNVNRESLSGLLAISATSELGEAPGGESYAVVSRDYLNLSIRFAYHFAVIDCLCGEYESQNYATLQFSGGAGNYYGRSLRVRLIGNVLEKLGFQISIKGDFLEASISRYDRTSLEKILDLLGRLLASSRLLDMTLSSQEDVERYTGAFFDGDYDFLLKREDSGSRNFYLQGGSWKRVIRDGRSQCLQDGSRWGRRFSSEVTGIIRKIIGNSYQEFLDTIEAYYYFPIAVLKEVKLSEGAVSLRIKAVGGRIDRAGGIAFGIKNIDNYFVARINALENNFLLFEFVNGKRHQRQGIRTRVESDRWYILRVELRGRRIQGFLDGKRLIDYTAERETNGFVGLWTKADSVTYFDKLTIETAGYERPIEFDF